jgi:hypothetical protein
LCGDFGVYEYDEPIVVIWKYTDKIKIDLGYKATIIHFKNMLKRCHPLNINNVKVLLGVTIR